MSQSIQIGGLRLRVKGIYVKEGIYVKVAATRGRWSVENRSLAIAHINAYGLWPRSLR